MLFNEYLKSSEITERKFPDGLELDPEVKIGMYVLLHSMVLSGLMVDQIKKMAIYNKAIADAQDVVNQAITEYETQNSDAEIARLVATQGPAYTQDQAEVFHALIGMASEMAEIIQVILPFITGEKSSVDTVSLSEELADFDWYRAILCRKYALDEHDFRARNIEKLKVRFPNAFDADRALNRNVEEERKALEGV